MIALNLPLKREAFIEDIMGRLRIARIKKIEYSDSTVWFKNTMFRSKGLVDPLIGTDGGMIEIRDTPEMQVYYCLNYDFAIKMTVGMILAALVYAIIEQDVFIAFMFSAVIIFGFVMGYNKSKYFIRRMIEKSVRQFELHE